MAHPFDEALQDTMAHRWLLPPFRLILNQPLLIGAIAALSMLIMWLAQAFAPSPFGNPVWEYVYTITLSAVMYAASVVFYRLFARAEGTPHGVGWTVEWEAILLRALLLWLCWLAVQFAVFFAINFLTKTFGPSIAKWVLSSNSGFAMTVSACLFFSVVLAWAVLFAWTQLISIALLVRTQMPAQTLFVYSFQVLWREPWRVVLPIGLISLALSLLFALALWKLGLFAVIELFGRIPEATRLIIYAVVNGVVLMWGFALWFVLERVYLPELGTDPDSELAPSVNVDSAASTDTAAPESAIDKLRIALEQAKPPLDAQAAMMASALRRKEVTWTQVCVECFANAKQVGRQVSGVLANVSPIELLSFHSLLARNLAQGNHWKLVAEVMQTALSEDPRFLSDSPNLALPFARGLISEEHYELALKLLAPFLREQRNHPDHLQAVLTAARLLLTHANKPDLARKMLLHFQSIYPNEPQIVQLLKLRAP
jgi:hypothetical protein